MTSNIEPGETNIGTRLTSVDQAISGIIPGTESQVLYSINNLNMQDLHTMHPLQSRTRERGTSSPKQDRHFGLALYKVSMVGVKS